MKPNVLTERQKAILSNENSLPKTNFDIHTEEWRKRMYGNPSTPKEIDSAKWAKMPTSKEIQIETPKFDFDDWNSEITEVPLPQGIPKTGDTK